MKEIPKVYNSKEYEKDVYKAWEDSGFFNPDNLPDHCKEPFSISMPPPNATGILHLGHASMLAIEDSIIRYKRMRGFKTLWLPGTDHAAIATQTKVEKIIAKEKLNRHDLGREKFIERVKQYVQESQDTIRGQIRQMGSSCDWSRERYTLDEGLTKTVQEVFVRMYQDGLIYRGKRIVNWCPRCESTLADDEVEHADEDGKLYYIKYPLEDNPEKYLTIATTRPETMLGDTAVAVSPNDERFKNLIGKNVLLPLTDKKIPVIADDHVDVEFGTGALKITPAHDKDDFEIGKRHGLEVINIFDGNGKLNEIAGKYAGSDINEARVKIVKDLEKLKLLEKIEDYKHSVGHCYRCDATIEPMVSLQWFIDVDKKIPGKEKSLKEASIESVRSGKIEIMPDRFKKIYFHWMENLHDWCISRQIWFGHRIPAYYCECGQVVVSLTPPSSCWKCGKNNFQQDPDTLDTWFSSGLWTFSTLGWPEETDDMKLYHPTSLMETGYDILFFWVARMILMSTYALDDIPFKKVYLHGLIKDKEGRKMSKSLDNGIDPIEMIEKFGADALRLSMLIGTTVGNDFKLYEEKIASFRNFVNKLWNVSRFIMSSCDSSSDNVPVPDKLADKWILGELNKTISNTTKYLDSYQLSKAGEILYEFTRDKLADWYLEISKTDISDSKSNMLSYILSTLLKLWHPLTPFVTETIWKEMEHDDLLMIAEWPTQITLDNQQEYTEQFELAKTIVVAIRNIRACHKIDTKKEIDVIIQSDPPSLKLRTGEVTELSEDQKNIIEKLARTKITKNDNRQGDSNNAVKIINDTVKIIVPLYDIIDTDQERNRLSTELKSLTEYAEKLEQELSNENFVSNAPEKVIGERKEKLKSTQNKIKKIKEQVSSLLS